MSQFFVIHPENPQPRLIHQTADIIRNGGVIAYPTDASYALGCGLGDKEAQQRIRAIRGVDEDHPLTLVCRDLAEISVYAKVDNRQFRLLKANTPGCYTFILEATREVPKRLQHPKRKTVGLRVPDHPILQALLAELGEPLLSSTLQLPGDDQPLNDPYTIRDLLERQVDLVLDGGYGDVETTTVIDLSGETPALVRAGKGDIHPFGLELEE
ncbi:MAG: threonylcarbamoyl-AMP synthase [Betaproteobacteria bacterium CG2_30_59_46]|nr:MAG: threonylcarbamoyl-AMP synthase [Betaproteobacteria bacterium CG2_30_59_46]PIQ13284.1 MAG: threonylcarbamoyl-AMP synthase [Hydrogenophilales bacterium CG18_big_fil_WC_8_21_14_2_50_58_12]PIY01399.1 MAG: threonylcarbamoyl-AMP synthase [Hydrogenophilales bacterium CG_4_10_14_3_um_filter_58_23]PJB03781.1 MAG: threonylcarbamoyl-AMP synthase [Hydrogenophilales bacterium CG_4_9_14_3_um_filter_59_35]